MKRLQGLFVTVVVICLCAAFAAADDTLTPDVPEHYALQTADEAIDLTLKYTGFEKCPGYDRATTIRDVRLETVNDTATQFLRDNINGREAWIIEFKDVVLKLELAGYGESQTLPMLFRIVIDAETGCLLWAQTNPGKQATNGADCGFGQPVIPEFQEFSGESNHGLPTELPFQSLAEVLGTWRRTIPEASTPIVVNYLMYTRPGSVCDTVPCPVWVKYHYKAGGTLIREVVHAMTGEMLYNVTCRPSSEHEGLPDLRQMDLKGSD
ncbi:MAG: hypothetical protein KOO62_13600 [candidate division Zixibacteria bacterium]|nr:hypothetical protein [candidate division Zixibacteria bacterium]